MNAAIAASQDAGGSGKGEAMTPGAVSAQENMKHAVMASATGMADRIAVSADGDPAVLAGDLAKAVDACSTPVM
jgi:hypothetical protein